MKVAVIKYNAGNIRSVSFALDRLNVDHVITENAEEIAKADKVIFPGVGEASTTMAYLKDHKLDKLIKDLRQPVLGVCLGMQLMCRHSDENNTPCLNIFDDTVRLFQHSSLKVPHMGWNALVETGNWLGQELENEFVYFVHSYYVPTNSFTVATCQYGIAFSAALRKDNFFAVQFHPEKSADVGEKVLFRFLNFGS